MNVSPEDLEKASRLAREAGAVVMRVYGTDFGVDWKGKADPVTQADREANEWIVKGIRELFPGDGIVAEESADRADQERGGRVWFVDPLDGTKEFIARNGEFSIMLGLAVDARATLGVVYRPTEDTLWAGLVGRGAWVERGGERRSVTVSEVGDLRRQRLVVSRSHASPLTDEMCRVLGITERRPSGSVGIKVGLIVEREADLYVHPTDRSSLWDACGPDAVLTAAGGCFTGLDGEPIVYGGTNPKNRKGIVASNGRRHAEVVAVISKLARDAGILG
ncbi:MAG: 3'(2'),5'-bisphosphate nucleotidase CysQ [Deltaproteobacteria bacterium]|nr:3'(2'),5'-bisphosphate nucleotidase CysQ [Deltaproteobacteria bacterium]